MITILHLIPTLAGGGAERQLSLLAKQQLKNGFVVNIGMRRGGVYEYEIIRSGIRVHRLGDWGGPNPILLRNLCRIINRLNPDLIHTWLPQMDILVGIASYFMSIPWVMTERSVKDAYSDFPIQTKMRIFNANRASKIVANSSAGVKYWQENLGHKKKIIMIENSIDINSIMNSAPLPLLSNHHKNPIILMVGPLIKSKKHNVLLAAIKLVLEKEKIKLIIIGDGNQKNSLSKLIKQLNLEEHVTLKPYNPEWWSYLKIASMLVSPSVIEGQPNVVLETMAAKCPLIVSDIPAHRQILDEESALIVPPNDKNKLADAILNQLSNNELGRKRAKLAFERIKKFSVELITLQYEEAYMDILK